VLEKDFTASQLRLMFAMQPWNKEMNFVFSAKRGLQKKENTFKFFFQNVDVLLAKEPSNLKMEVQPPTTSSPLRVGATDSPGLFLKQLPVLGQTMRCVVKPQGAYGLQQIRSRCSICRKVVRADELAQGVKRKQFLEISTATCLRLGP